MTGDAKVNTMRNFIVYLLTLFRYYEDDSLFWRDGFEARRSGKSISSAPATYFSAEALSFRRGWLARDR